jgi:diguanylate cyclase (GGDEF)-like protein
MFSELLVRAIQPGEVSHKRTAVLFVDLDGFKLVNDTLGHDGGDALLREVAQRIKECLRTSDVLARMGGDEFVVLAQQVDGPGDVLQVARKILAAVQRPINLQLQTCSVTASIGISMYGEDCSDERSLMRNADIAMYAAKQKGKNGFQLFCPGMDKAGGLFR